MATLKTETLIGQMSLLFIAERDRVSDQWIKEHARDILGIIADASAAETLIRCVQDRLDKEEMCDRATALSVRALENLSKLRS